MDSRSARREDPPAILLAFGVVGLLIALTGNLAGELSGIALVVVGSLITMAAALTFFVILVERLWKWEKPQP